MPITILDTKDTHVKPTCTHYLLLSSVLKDTCVKPTHTSYALLFSDEEQG
ncbi:hypothetical protein HanIR_Chr12g0600741 [Helianthus annuus]|nr:hypothetical protein HanIR_Chr12g0600741 [Helianthus annuus]